MEIEFFYMALFLIIECYRISMVEIPLFAEA